VNIKAHVRRAMDDLAKEVFLRLAQELEDSAGDDEKMSLWKTSQDIEQEWKAFEGRATPTTIAGRERRMSRIENALETLTADQRDALYLHLGRGMTCAEIARQTNTPRAVVLSDLLRAYSRLRLLLGDEDLGDLYLAK